MTKLPENSYAVILAGGGGTRLWPKSRKKHPKHLLNLFGKESMLQMTYERIATLLPPEKIFIITLADHADLVLDQLPKFDKNNLIVEPIQKNTALAMGVAAAFVRKRNEDAVIINLAADQMISDEKKFQKSVILALEVAAERDDIVAIGIRPTFAHTGLGYIRIGEQLDNRLVFKCKGFKEKPDLVTAQSFFASGQYLWNANLYCWSTATIFDAMREHSPKISAGMEKVFAAVGQANQAEVVKEVYEKSESVQIDYAVSERAKNLVVVPGDFGWSDIGDWKVVYDSNQKDSNGNVFFEKKGDVVGIDIKNCLVESNGRLVVAIGLENIVIVETEDAILVCNKDKTQDVKKAIEKLKEKKKDQYL